MRQPFQRLQNGNPYTRRNFNKVLSRVEQLKQLNVAAPLQVQDYGQGQMLTLGRRNFWAVITGRGLVVRSSSSSSHSSSSSSSSGSSSSSSSSSSATAAGAYGYSWREIQPDGEGGWEYVAGGMVGELALNPAYELNSNADVPVGTVVWLRNNYDLDYAFDYCCDDVARRLSLSSSSSSRRSSSSSSSRRSASSGSTGSSFTGCSNACCLDYYSSAAAYPNDINVCVSYVNPTLEAILKGSSLNGTDADIYNQHTTNKNMFYAQTGCTAYYSWTVDNTVNPSVPGSNNFGFGLACEYPLVNAYAPFAWWIQVGYRIGTYPTVAWYGPINVDCANLETGIIDTSTLPGYERFTVDGSIQSPELLAGVTLQFSRNSISC